MEGGEIAQSGKYDTLLEEGRGFKQLINAHEDAMGTVHHHDNDDAIDEFLGNKEVINEMLNRSESQRMLMALSQSRSRRGSQREREGPVPATQLTQQEEREVGDQGWSIYLQYIRVANGWIMWWLGFISQGIFVLANIAANYWMATKVNDPATSDAKLIGVYASLSVMSGVFVFLRSRFNVLLGLRASANFFRLLVTCLFRAPMSFFDSTPMGRIISRVKSQHTLSPSIADALFIYICPPSSTKSALRP
jgi:ATP-binding cassette subfamily C (CFTR/MRP) protein 2